MKKLLLAPALLALALPALQGCVPAVATGVGAGALIAVDRRPAETYLADEAIEIRAINRIGEKFGDKVHVNVTSYNYKVLLTGEVPDVGTQSDLEKAVAGVANVKGVVNEVTVGPASNFSARSNDTYITSKVKARFIDANRFQTNHVKVVTEAGTVFLLGLVTRKEADDATAIARTTADVKRVVRAFEYVHIREEPRKDGRSPEDAKAGAAEQK